MLLLECMEDDDDGEEEEEGEERRRGAEAADADAITVATAKTTKTKRADALPPFVLIIAATPSFSLSFFEVEKEGRSCRSVRGQKGSAKLGLEAGRKRV